jgi:signal peptidase I
MRKGSSAIVEIIQTIVISLSLYLIIHLFVVQPNKVEGNSMFPTLHNSERILTSKLTYRLRAPQRGDIVVFAPPTSQKGDYIKRIIALPGDTISLINGQVRVNGTILSENYLPVGQKTSEKQFLRDGQSFIVPTDNYIVLGDNRPFSSDSREWGPISKDSIVGVASWRYWPFSEFGKLDNS